MIVVSNGVTQPPLCLTMRLRLRLMFICGDENTRNAFLYLRRHLWVLLQMGTFPCRTLCKISERVFIISGGAFLSSALRNFGLAFFNANSICWFFFNRFIFHSFTQFGCTVYYGMVFIKNVCAKSQ